VLQRMICMMSASTSLSGEVRWSDHGISRFHGPL
jgi:hypothetical protein